MMGAGIMLLSVAVQGRAAIGSGGGGADGESITNPDNGEFIVNPDTMENIVNPD